MLYINKTERPVSLLLHDGTALEHLEQLGQTLLDHLLDLVVLVLLLLLLLLLVVLLLTAVVLATMLLLAWISADSTAMARRDMGRRRHLVDATALQVDKDSTLVLLGTVLQAQLATHLLDARLDFLNVVAAVVALAYNDVQMGLALLASDLDALLEHVFGFFDKQAVQVDCVAVDAPFGIVGAEDKVAGLPVVLLHLLRVLLSFLRELVGGGAIAGLVGLVRAVKT